MCDRCFFQSVSVSVVKVFSVFDDMPAVISVENGYNIKGYLKGSRGIGEPNPIDGMSPLDALYFTKDLGKTLKTNKLERLVEWDADKACWVIVADYNKNDNAERDMDEILTALQTLEGEGKAVGGELVKVIFEHIKITEMAEIQL